jgi:hypothetical protein
LPPRSAFHTLRHSHAMWRRLFACADISALVASGLWTSRNAASVYEHLDLTAESRKSDLFPTPDSCETRAVSAAPMFLLTDQSLTGCLETP